MAQKLIIKNGLVYDPINKILGEKKDIFITDGKICEEFKDTDADLIDAKGCIVLSGGVDIHSHISGAKVNLGRLFRPEDHIGDPVKKTSITRSGSGYSVPSTFVTGYRYAKMGYTTVTEPAMPPLKARHTHEEFSDCPIIDKLAFPLFGNNWFVMEYIKNGDFDKLKAYVAWLLNATKGYAVKIVNPGGVESWAWGKNCESLDEKVLYFEVTPRQILENLAKVNEELGLPHTIHVHGNNLGHPGNYQMTLDTYDLMKGVKPGKNHDSVMHMTHAQFNAYSGTDWKDFGSGAADICDYLNKHNHITIDAGQVIFTNTTTMTADGPWEYALHHIGGVSPWGNKPGIKWVNGQVEGECGSGLTPYIFNPKNGVNSIQWAIGLEIMLGIKNPKQVFLTTDHPNGGPFIYYPTIISWLMSKKTRNKRLGEINEMASSKSGLVDLEREYTIEEIAWITRAGTAQCLGLKEKGHLGIGADGDVAVYRLDPNEKDGKTIEKAFSDAAFTIKSGEIVVKNGEIVKVFLGNTIYSDVTGKIKKDMLESVIDDVRAVWDSRYSINYGNYAVQEVYCENPIVHKGV
ncbi:MAG: formylmethanofuran dehydrogenase subunit A [Candidatus Lokiarchaeota archaeon]|nr:formylmethanofuran dehydrogenase subunit A [Candidatus Lokiarchaeota archaeon]